MAWGPSPLRAVAIRAARDVVRRDAALRQHARYRQGGAHGLPAEVHVHRQGRGHDEVTLSPTSRHRMLENTWHVGVAQAVLYMFLVLALVPSAKAAAFIPAQPHLTCMHRITAWCNATPGLWQPSAADYRMGHHRTVTEDDCAHVHIAMAFNVSHPALADSNLSLSPAAAFVAVWMYDTIGPDIVRWRLEVLSEIGALVDDLVPDWADTLPSHVTMSPMHTYSGN